MSPRRILFFWLGAIGPVFSPATFAQSETPVPRPPYIAPVPSYAHWTIKIQPSSSPGSTPSAQPTRDTTFLPLMIDTVKTGDTKQVTLSYAGQPPEEINEKDGIVFLPTPKGTLMVHEPPANLPTAPGSSPLDAADPELEGPYPLYSPGFLFARWLASGASSSFKDVVIYNQVRCFHYQNGGDEAWIDVATMLPVALRHDGIEADYQFLAPPTSPLQLPPDEAVSLQQTEDAAKAFNSVR
jgi:hypothetical protein